MTSLIRMLLIVGLAPASVATGNVIGEDSRRVPGPEQAELMGAVGQIVCTRMVDNRQRSARGTGTIVGSQRTVLTAAHVLVDEAGRGGGPRVEFEAETDCVFRQYDEEGRLIAEATFSHATYGEFRRNAAAPDQDWAVLTTVAPLPEPSAALPFAVGIFPDPDSGERMPIEILAFHADTPQLQARRRLPLYSEGSLFGIRYAGLLRLAHTADTGRMSSGAALVYQSESGQHVVVGVNRSGANFGEFNLGVALTAELTEALRSHAYGQVPRFRQQLANRP